MTARQTQGIGLAVSAMVFSGVANFANGLVVAGIDPLVHSVVKNGIVGIAVVGILLMAKKWQQVKQLSRKQWGQLAAIAVIGGSIPFWLFFTGVKLVGGVDGAMIHKTLIVWVALLAVPLLKERISLKMGIGIVVLFLSNYLWGFAGLGTITWAHGLLLLATVMWAVENVIAKVALQSIDPDVLVGARMGGGAVILSVILMVTGKGPLLMALSGTQWLMLLGVAMLLFGFVMSWYRALKLLPVTVVASILVGATVVNTVVHSVFTGQLNLSTLGQVILVASGVYWVVMAVMDEWVKTGKQNKPVMVSAS